MLETVRLIRAIWSDRNGVTAVEYGIIAALVSVVIISAVTLLGTNLTSMFGKISTAVGT